ncbi:cysteine hydrolase [Fervidicoccus fontis]|jgi:nicotinamidase-related amidase|uniref:Isochorismatase hydrolase n=2 Tax=Fervidicoccus fontis TaxID=683846 RepID=I0A0G0_FERFK|nr:isochorismatase family cysteine hydrolase [Fervidicoccus fontis]AFH42467.1 isochorismatase hydrolase [Fervidicoccus fontis Kam940]MBE9391081.1 cysteine hydrolase [Fervidicoccus fontis]PMB77021.1 MAG: hydrolase [Fervidicoccus fontis]HEW63675.1 cysteine hydrolase [Fervidicoccus fontis]
MKFSLIIIDMIHDFVDGKFGNENVKKIIPCIRELKEFAKKNSIPVIYAVDSHIKGVDREIEVWGEHAIEGEWGSKIIEELEPQNGEFIIKKRRYSAFFSTGLDLLLRELDVDTLILTGTSTHICVLHTAADAFFRGYKIIIPKECVAAFSESDHGYALVYMSQVYGAKVLSKDEIKRIIEENQNL